MLYSSQVYVLLEFMIEEILIKEGVKTAFKVASTFYMKNKFKMGFSEGDIEKSLINHINHVKNWSSEIVFKDLKKAKRTQDIYIKLNTYVYPRRNRINDEEEIEEVGLMDIFETEDSHIAILGQPGAGKTTSMKFICQSIFFDEKFYSEKFKYPILIRLRDFNKPLKNKNHKIIVDYIYSLVSLQGIKDQGIQYDLGYEKKEEIVVDLLNSLKVLLIIEGFDELGYKKHRDLVLEELAALATKLETARMILTSRTADYYYSFEKFSEFEICPLNSKQIKDFATKWLGDSQSAEEFLRAVDDSPFSDATIRPITIAHLCAIFERVGKIPEKPKTVYKKIVNLLLEEWDEQRNIKRESSYAKFETDRKFEFLTNLAFFITGTSRRSIFSKNDLKFAYDRIHQDFDLSKREVDMVINELESHTGLFIKSGFELYEFAHKSLQEYLTAEYIVRLPTIPEGVQSIRQFPNEFAIAIAISSNSSFYFNEFIYKRISRINLPKSFYQTFINRLLLEKPEFNRDQSVGISALLLYSLALSGSSDNKQLHLFVMDNLVKEYEEFMIHVFKRNSINEILKKYKLEAKEESLNSTTVLRLVLKNEDANNNVIERYPLPKHLSCRESFIE
ncbi:NACHT domain-containing protein [Negadavirga shengliensis]|uniref:NACHT domain-containing protein n=1 Tax=Negadavirga shengliensis TaxID=1389218 RepID=A0ABV9T8U4_9BACT